MIVTSRPAQSLRSSLTKGFFEYKEDVLRRADGERQVLTTAPRWQSLEGLRLASERRVVSNSTRRLDILEIDDVDFDVDVF